MVVGAISEGRRTVSDEQLPQILSYGGGRQTIATCVLVRRGILPRPDRVVIADTGREKRSTWEYMAAHVAPLMREVGLEIEVASRSLATVDLYARNGDLLLPVYTATGKLPGYCSNEWKARVVRRHLRETGVGRATMWIGFSLDEGARIRKAARGEPGAWPERFPLTELMLTTADCVRIVEDFGWPTPPQSACWSCPNMRNHEWAEMARDRPDEFEAACVLDEEVRAEDRERGGSGVYLHHSRASLRDADLTAPESHGTVRQCGLGMCFV
jgi:hypothetical protein